MHIHNITGKYNRAVPLFLLWAAGLAGMLGSCKRAMDAPILRVTDAVRDSSGDIRTVLTSPACSCTLFDHAFSRASLDSPFLFYTVLAPTDSAMTAAGLTAAAIDALTVDSLNKIVGYQLVQGAFGGDTSVLYNDTLSVVLPTVRKDVEAVLSGSSLLPYYYQQNLHIWSRDAFYVNGVSSGAGKAPMKASNGWIYPINRVLSAPTQSVWSILQVRPELSLYLAAIRLVDSIASQNYVYGQVYDSVIFSNGNYVNYAAFPLVNVTVLAPTNDAFAAAGFNTIDDIRRLALQTLPGGANFDALDSVLKLHYLYTPGAPSILYQDMLYSPLINNGIYNSNSWYVTQYASTPGATPVYPQFTNVNGTVDVQWNPNLPPASLPAGSGPLLATNGVIYESSQLFYPHN